MATADFDLIAGRSGTVKPVVGTSGETEASVLRADYGDGYSQRVADGLNHLRQQTTIRWIHKTEAQWQEVRDFLKPKLGVEVFTYTDFGEDQARRWICTRLRGPTPEHGNLYTFSATLREEFGQ